MAIYFYWGEDDFLIQEEITKIKKNVLDLDWIQFNYEKLSGQKEEDIRAGLNQAMTPAFGSGDRLVWLEEISICQSCTEELLTELTRTLPQIPDNSHLLFTSSKKPDARLKSTKLLQKYATVKNFELIPIWQIEAIAKKVKEIAEEKEINLTKSAIEMLAKSVGNDSRLLTNELEKLALYQSNKNIAIDEEVIKNLVNISMQNSLALATTIIRKDLSQALQLINELINLNEPALRIVATLVGQFRTWILVKLMLEKGDKNDQEIAVSVGVGNPKRVYFLKQEIKSISSQQLLKTLPLFLELELGLKKGANPLMILESKVIEIINILR